MENYTKNPTNVVITLMFGLGLVIILGVTVIAWAAPQQSLATSFLFINPEVTDTFGE